MKIPALRSSYDTVCGLVHFGRMIDKIRLYAAGKLPQEYHPYLGDSDPLAFDGRCCRFLKIDYDTFAARAKRGGTDAELFDWACLHDGSPSEEEIDVWNAFMRKRGWRDSRVEALQKEASDVAITDRIVATYFDLHDAEEGRPARFPADPPPTALPPKEITCIPGLRSPWETVGGIVHFGRMIDKIHLFQRNELPPAWVAAKGSVRGFDGCCCRFLQVEYTELEEQVVKGRSDTEVLNWAFATGRKPNDEQIETWNAYLSKRCWRDQYTDRLYSRMEEVGMPVGSVYTMFDFIDLDEGRPMRTLS
jgi:hypothetical protein